ncbi:hypothetical protein HAHI6034_11405 [Hathewaya histolytica]|uniref:Uncharacterized protein n=1 Tax=Hathewaya histolytica TaxID=1498 RepID=A0A4V6KCY6_HATHI|nr:hypothetical protein [Hathewaya histolytica]VTQ88267.1 Uncharacterised protein [Hathewaya histolytica]
MSRSFHSNVRDYIKERNYKYSNEGIKEEKLNQIGEELYRKSFTKKMTICNRKVDNRNIKYMNPSDLNTIKIKIKDKEKYIHFPLNKEDLLGVIKRMPYNIVSGIHSITLCLGKEYQEGKVDNLDKEVRDPYTGRICIDEYGPIYSPPILGTYYTRTCKIFLYAYVYDREKIKLGIIESYLRLQMLSTLVHEIAHHEDNLLRAGGGRWLGFNDRKCEDYAELQQLKWTETVVIPYLIDNYPEEYCSLLNWIEKHGGVKLSLVDLIDKSRIRRIGDKIKIVSGASLSGKWLFKNIINGMNEHDAMLEFAKDLYWEDYGEECLKVIDILLLNNPKDSEVLSFKADIYINLRYKLRGSHK